MKASFLLAKSVVPHMQNQGKGSIVFISSIGGFHPIPVSINKMWLNNYGKRETLADMCIQFFLQIRIFRENDIKRNFCRNVYSDFSADIYFFRENDIKRNFCRNVYSDFSTDIDTYLFSVKMTWHTKKEKLLQIGIFRFCYRYLFSVKMT